MEQTLKKNLGILIVVLGGVYFSIPGNAAAKEEKEPIFQLFVGNWQSNEPAFGLPAKSTMVWKSILGGKFVQLDYQIEMKTPSGDLSVFEGVGIYPAREVEPFKAIWADNNGDLHPIVFEREGNALIAIWGTVGIKQGRTRYELLGPDEMKVIDWIKTPEGWKIFNQKQFSRAKNQ